MDKYTVDLDKVLNDFEYSELTEQIPVEATPSISNCYPGTSNDNRSRNSNVKHSINNVFNSLNEYLNTDISGKPKDTNVTENPSKIQYSNKFSEPEKINNKNFNPNDKKNIPAVDVNRKLNNLSQVAETPKLFNPMEIIYKSIFDKVRNNSSNSNSMANFNDFATNARTEPRDWYIPDISCSNDEFLSLEENVENNEFVGILEDAKGCDVNSQNKLKERGVDHLTKKIDNKEKEKLHNFDQFAKENHENIDELRDILDDMKLDVDNVYEGSTDHQHVVNKIDEPKNTESSVIMENVNINVIKNEIESGDEISEDDGNDNQMSLQERTKINEIYKNIGDMSKILEDLPKNIEKISLNVENMEKDFVEEPKNMEVIKKPNAISKKIKVAKGKPTKLLDKPPSIERFPDLNRLHADIEEIPINEKLVSDNIEYTTDLPKNIEDLSKDIEDASKNIIGLADTVEDESTNIIVLSKNLEEAKDNINIEDLATMEESKDNINIEDLATMEDARNIVKPVIISNVSKSFEKSVVLSESVEELPKNLRGKMKVADNAKINKIPTKTYELPKCMPEETREIINDMEGLPTYIEVIANTNDTSKSMGIPNANEATSALDPIPVGFDLNFDDSELNQYLEILEEELERKSDSFIVDEKIKALKEETAATDKPMIGLQENKTPVEKVFPRSAGVTERPNSLELDKSDKKRQINLIGNPGSTPYNNVYISKEIPTEKTSRNPHPYESESSTSVSPTFSEASTDSIRSTESTDTDNDRGNVAGAILPDDDAQRIEKIEENEVEEELANLDTETPTSTSTVIETAENIGDAENSGDASDPAQNIVEEETLEDEHWVGKRAPLWIPDADALNCLHCDMKFTVIKRRHHCRACGLVLCSKCCGLKHRLEYLDQESRVCTKCYEILTSRDTNSLSGSEMSPADGNSPSRQAGQPNPNNPMEYCSQVPPLQQMNSGGDLPPTVMVPVGVLKRKGSNKVKHNKSVMFCDGIRPGSDLTNLDNDFNYNETRTASKKHPAMPKINRNQPLMDPTTKSFIPEQENSLPPIITRIKTDITYTDCANNAGIIDLLKAEIITFAIQKNLLVHLKLINMDCCINKQAWCFSTEGLISVGQDEVVILLECTDNENVVPKDIFNHLNNIYNDALKGTTVTELGISMHPNTNFLDSKNHAGFLYIRPSFQCLQNVIIPKEPYLIGLLIHRWETPWAKIFPLRLILRLGAEYRYYPSPLISTRHRDSVFVEIGQTIINLLADFRNFSYTLPSIRGLSIHMEDKNTTVTLPANRYDQVMKSLNDSTEHILAFGGNFSSMADSHLVCIQDLHGNNENAYTTHAINIQNKPRKVTGASFIVFNGALKSSSGLTAKSSIVEDGLMIQIPAEHMVHLRESLRNMKNHTIQCGCINATSDESVNIVWGDPDINFNIGIKSSVDEQSLNGVPSIRVHNGKDYICNSGNRLLRWTEVFLLQNGEENARTQDPVDISKIAESISKATCQALVKYLDLLATNNFYKIGIRATLHVENVSYSAGSNGIKLPPIYMRSLDNELVPVLHRITANNLGENAIILELIFRILNV